MVRSQKTIRSSSNHGRTAAGIAAAAALAGAALLAAMPPATANPQPLPQPQSSAGASAEPSPVLPLPGAVEILREAEHVARQNPDPNFVVYDMHEIFIHHGRQFTYDYHVWYRTYDGKGLMQNAVADRRGHREQRFGYPFPFAPDINILLYATPPPTPTPIFAATPAPVASGQTPVPIIGESIVTANRYYSVTLAGVEDYQGHPVFHLLMLPLPNVDEKVHPWKDLWVDMQTYEVWKAHARASGTRGPLSGAIEGMAEFQPVNGYWLLSHVTGYGEGHLAFISDSGQYEYYFSGFDFPNTLPDWYFDPDLFRHH